MENSLILCGGTGAHVGVALLRLHTLGYALGFFDQGSVAGEPRAFPFPRIFLVDQDSGDADGRERTAWQLLKSLIDLHPGRVDCARAFDRAGLPEHFVISPLPVGEEQDWFRPPNDRLDRRFSSSPLLPVVASSRQREIEYAKGMMGSPALGALLFRLKEHDGTPEGGNHDGQFDELLRRTGRAVVVGSGVGGTGAAVTPVLARQLARTSQVMAVLVLRWFEFLEDGHVEQRERARRRNRLMRENAHSALAFHGGELAKEVAAVPVGMPMQSFQRREFTGDVGQSVFESYIHAVAALAGLRQFLGQPYRPGLYAMGAVDPGRLDGATAIPGGTLQGLANQAATALHLMKVWRSVLLQAQDRRVQPALYRLVAETGVDPVRVGESLGDLLGHYGAQIDWLREVLGVTATVHGELTRELESRRRWADSRRGLGVDPQATPGDVAATAFHWGCDWIRSVASQTNRLEVKRGGVGGHHWPDLVAKTVTVSAEKSGHLTSVPEANIPVVLAGFVDHELVNVNGWPHPVAAADFFRLALEQGSPLARRQLELLLIGVVSGVLEIRPLSWSEEGAGSLSLERLLAEERRAGSPGLARSGVFYPRLRLLIGFNSPHTLLCPVPFTGESDDHKLWQELWTQLAEPSDAAPWHQAPAPASWGRHQRHLAQIRSWIAELRQVHPVASPPTWAEVFRDPLGGEEEDEPFGIGISLEVFWGGQGESGRVEVELPAGEVSDWVPPATMPVLPAEEALRRIEGLAELRSPGGSRLCWSVELEMPDRPEKVRGFWQEHLEQLRRRGGLRRFGVRPNGDVWVISRQEGQSHATFFDGSVLLRPETVLVDRVVPLEQDPVPGSRVPARQLRYPDLPLRSDYVALAEMPDDRRTPVMERVRNGDDFRSDRWAPRIAGDRGGRRVAIWELRLAGLAEPLKAEIPLADESGDPAAEAAERAHWMVWPRFRSRNPALWRTYFLFDHCESRQLGFDTLWLDGGDRAEVDAPARLRRLASPLDEPGPYPLCHQPGVAGHCGGPPVALALRHRGTDKEHGLYWVHLDVVEENSLTVDVGIDFGTSHSVVACGVDGETAEPLGFAPELTPVSGSGRGLSLHVSENAARAVDAADGVLALGTWVPTYRRTDCEGVLPSELLLRDPRIKTQGGGIREWAPCGDFFIPPLDLLRSRVSEVLVADFKWDASAGDLRGRERELRDHYLGLLLDLAMAEIVGQRLGALPAGGVNLTLTYPLRSNRAQVLALQESLARLVERGERSYGVPFRPAQNGGLFDESRAAQVPTQNVGEVTAVADLGGGTLDLFISAFPIAGQDFREVADSVRLGGNVLLHRIAERADNYLPGVSGWRHENPNEVAARLRAWMRARGWPALFSDGGGRIRLEELELGSFGSIGESRPIERLLHRYFCLLVDYLARNLAAYLAEEWFPKAPAAHHERLRISLQLRGNGWRLRYREEGYDAITAAVTAEVRSRLGQLWTRLPDPPRLDPSEERYWASPGSSGGIHPKAEPIRKATGRGMLPEEVRNAWHTYTLVELDLVRTGARIERVPWTSRVPFHAGGGASQVEVGRLSPPLLLSRATEDRAVELEQLERRLQGEVNRKLQDEHEEVSEGYRAPVAAAVWEAAFESAAVWPDKATK